jgi:hypothetical protein
VQTTPNGVADSQLIRGAPSAYIKAGNREILLSGDRELTLPREAKWRFVVFNVVGAWSEGLSVHESQFASDQTAERLRTMRPVQA